VIRFLPLLLLVCIGCGPKLPSQRSGTLDLLVTLGKEPIRLEFKPTIDGKSVVELWDAAFAKLHAYADRDGDGFLNKTEAARLPTPFAIRQIVWGQFVHSTGVVSEELDLNSDAKVSIEELADYYRRAGLGNVLVGVGKPPSTDKLTDALLKTVGTTEAEWKKAAEVLAKLDSNDDELIGPGELVERTAYPGADGKTDPTCEALPLVLLPQRLSDNHWNKTGKLERDSLKILSSKFDLTKTSEVSADINLLDEFHEVIRIDTGKLPEQTTAARKKLLATFAECDADGNGILDEKELSAPKAITLLPLVNEKTLGKKDVEAWFDVQEQFAKCSVLLTILDHGKGLFEVLDRDHDGSLSQRELHKAWERLVKVECITDGKLDRTKLKRNLMFCFSLGHPQSALIKPVRPGPAWFTAMDRNNDGHVSKREFTGPAETFAKLDTDGDGLLSAEEAEKAGK
jgi:EF hand/EF-hand domain pair